MKIKTAVLFLLCGLTVSAQQIQFYHSDLQTALSLAKNKKKNLFIDTYASYCKPCKVMEKEFRNPELAKYLNENFVNIKVDMEGEKAQEYALEYQIVFFPTMIFVSPEGHVLAKIDNIVSARELLGLAELFGPQPSSTTIASTTPPVKKEPTTAPTLADNTTNNRVTHQSKSNSTVPAREEPIELNETGDEKILYVMGQDTDKLPPEVLKEEAYFRMQLMDGSHHEAAKKYLKTQEDWLIEENILFIHDFLHDARSKEFEFMLENQAIFESVIGPERIGQTINILVNKELERGYPRPNLKRAADLYTYAGKSQPLKKAYAYRLNNLYEASEIIKFLELANEVDIKNIGDAKVLHRTSVVRLNYDNSKKSLKECLELSELATTLDPKVPAYHYNKAKVALQLKKRKVAEEAALKALALTADEEDQKKIALLLEQINLL